MREKESVCVRGITLMKDSCDIFVRYLWFSSSSRSFLQLVIHILYNHLYVVDRSSIFLKEVQSFAFNTCMVDGSIHKLLSPQHSFNSRRLRQERWIMNDGNRTNLELPLKYNCSKEENASGFSGKLSSPICLRLRSYFLKDDKPLKVWKPIHVSGLLKSSNPNQSSSNIFIFWSFFGRFFNFTQLWRRRHLRYFKPQIEFGMWLRFIQFARLKNLNPTNI